MRQQALEQVSAAALLELLPKLGEQERRISLALYRLLAEGLPVSSEQIAVLLNLQGDVIEATLHRWWGVHYDAQQRVTGYWGLALPPTAHRLTIEGKTLYAWCAWDTLFIPELIGRTIHIESRCPATERNIRLSVGPHGIIHRDPLGMVMSFITPEAAKVRENVVAHFCHYVHFFHSTEAAARWVSMHPGTFTVSIEEAYALAKDKNAAQYREALTAGS